MYVCIQYVRNRQYLTPINSVDTYVIKAFTVGKAFGCYNGQMGCIRLQVKT